MGDKGNGATAERLLCEGVAKAGLLSSVVEIRENKWTFASVDFELDVAVTLVPRFMRPRSL